MKTHSLRPRGHSPRKDNLVLKFRNKGDGKMYFHRFEDQRAAMDSALIMRDAGFVEPVSLLDIYVELIFDKARLDRIIDNHQPEKIYPADIISCYPDKDVPAVKAMQDFIGGDIVSPQEWHDSEKLAKYWRRHVKLMDRDPFYRTAWEAHKEPTP